MTHLTWNASPEMLHLGPITLRWYGALFAFAFYTGYSVMRRIFIREKASLQALETLLGYVFAGTVIGARLGHCLFYEPETYLNDPIRILKVWEGGLASHGAAIGVFVAFALFRRKHPELPYLWLADRLATVTPWAGACIRLGNFFNSEILGKSSDAPWAIIFERVDPNPRHPSMLYEAACYAVISAVLLWMYFRREAARKPGLLLGTFLSLVFGVRFLIEFTKENQVDFETSWSLNLGQLLSLPLIAAGVWLVRRALRSAR